MIDFFHAKIAFIPLIFDIIICKTFNHVNKKISLWYLVGERRKIL